MHIGDWYGKVSRGTRGVIIVFVVLLIWYGFTGFADEYLTGVFGTAGIQKVESFSLKRGGLISRRRQTFEDRLESFSESLCARIEREIPELIKRGYAEDVSAGDLYHVHVCFEQAEVGRRHFSELLLQGGLDSYSLLYHSLERLQLLKAEWLSQLEQIGDPDINMWMSRREHNRFEYKNLNYSAPKPSTLHNPLNWAKLHQFSMLWCNWLTEHHPEKTLCCNQDRLQQRLRYKLIILSGAQHPHYYAAVEALMRTRVCRTSVSEGASVFFTEAQVVPEGLWYPITVYFVQKAALSRTASILDKVQKNGISCVYGSAVQKRLRLSPQMQKRHNTLLYLLRQNQPSANGSVFSGQSLTGFEEILGYPQRCILIYSGEDYLFALWPSFLDNAVK